jgi:hypothetical protein
MLPSGPQSSATWRRRHRELLGREYVVRLAVVARRIGRQHERAVGAMLRGGHRELLGRENVVRLLVGVVRTRRDRIVRVHGMHLRRSPAATGDLANLSRLD